MWANESILRDITVTQSWESEQWKKLLKPFCMCSSPSSAHLALPRKVHEVKWSLCMGLYCHLWLIGQELAT